MQDAVQTKNSGGESHEHRHKHTSQRCPAVGALRDMTCAMYVASMDQLRVARLDRPGLLPLTGSPSSLEVADCFQQGGRDDRLAPYASQGSHDGRSSTPIRIEEGVNEADDAVGWRRSGEQAASAFTARWRRVSETD